MSEHSLARARAETRFDRHKRQTEEGAVAMTEYEAGIAATAAKTARLRALRLEKEQVEREEKALAVPAAKKRPRSKSPSGNA